MAELLQKDDPVMYRHQMRNGVAVEHGQVISVDDEGIQATVHFPTLNKIQKIAVNDLQKTSEVYGNVRVNPSPARRTLRTLIP